MSQQYNQQPTSGQHDQRQRGQPMQQGGGQQSGMHQPQMQQQQPRMQSGGMQSGGNQRPGTQTQGMRQSQGMQGGMRPQFEDHLTNELRIALEDFGEVSHIAEWCAKECMRSGPQMATCARICTDLAELAELNERWIARDSMFGPDLAEEFVRIATEALPELEQHQQAHPHVGETINAITRAIESCETVLQMGGQGTMGREMPQSGGGGQMGGGQMGGQMSGGQQPMGGQQF